MIQIVLVTGFLGAGKTTLMQLLLESESDKKVGVIVNEFGKINIDARLIEKDGIQMSELSNGSIFCACIKDKFVDSLIEMSYQDLDYLFIEASGMADPSNMQQILDGIRPKTGTEYLLKGSACVVDSEHFLDMVDMIPALERQVRYAGAVIVNKADLANKAQIQEIRERIKEINDQVDIFPVSYCKVDCEELMNSFSPVLAQGEETTNTYESRPGCFIVKAREVIAYDRLMEFLKAVAKDSYRIKGFAATDKGDYEVSAVVETIQITPWHEKLEESEIVIISAVGVRMMSLITAASREHVDGKLVI